MPELSQQRRELFAREYLKDLCGAAAARRIGINDASARSEACRMLAEPEVQDRIAELMAERNQRTEIEADEVLREIRAIATADTNELIEYRRTCCRYCWGDGFRYQRTQGERERDLASHNTRMKTDDKLAPFDEQGGVGFKRTREPNAGCPECEGEGVGEVFAKDTRKLSPAARALYAGAKVTKDGIEIKTHSKDKHVELLARHLGLLNDKMELTGADGGPLEVSNTTAATELAAILAGLKARKAALPGDCSDLA